MANVEQGYISLVKIQKDMWRRTLFIAIWSAPKSASLFFAYQEMGVVLKIPNLFTCW